MKSNMSRRARRISDLIAREVSNIMRTKSSNSSFDFVTITDAKISNDLRVAHIYYSVFGDDEEIRKTEERLDRAVGFFRGEIGKRLELRYTPEIHFVYDDTAETAQRIFSTLEIIEQEMNKKADDE